ncbi:hypothetical protein COBT_000029 [Conglomerata obtusa]
MKKLNFYIGIYILEIFASSNSVQHVTTCSVPYNVPSIVSINRQVFVDNEKEEQVKLLETLSNLICKFKDTVIMRDVKLVDDTMKKDKNNAELQAIGIWFKLMGFIKYQAEKQTYDLSIILDCYVDDFEELKKAFGDSELKNVKIWINNTFMIFDEYRTKKANFADKNSSSYLIKTIEDFCTSIGIELNAYSNKTGEYEDVDKACTDNDPINPNVLSQSKKVK